MHRERRVILYLLLCTSMFGPVKWTCNCLGADQRTRWSAAAPGKGGVARLAVQIGMLGARAQVFGDA
jgi:hypothetical protein